MWSDKLRRQTHIKIKSCIERDKQEEQIGSSAKSNQRRWGNLKGNSTLGQIFFFNHGLRLKALFPPWFLWNLIWDTPELKLSCKFLFFCLICLFYFSWFSSSRIFYSFYIPLICVFLLPSMSFIPLLNVFNISFTALYNSYILKAVIKIKFHCLDQPWLSLPMLSKSIAQVLLIVNSPSIIPLGCAGGCQISLTELVLTSGNKMPTGGPGTVTANEKSLGKNIIHNRNPVI